MNEPGAAPTGGPDDVATITAQLDEGGPGRVVVLIGALRTGIRALCWVAALTGLTALAFGALAWRSTPEGVVVTVLVAVPAVVLPLYIARRSSALADAVTHPGEVVDQTKDLVVRAAGSPELHRLATRVRSRRSVPGTQVGRIRRVVSSGRMVSAVIGLADPDPVHHRLLVPFTPERLRNLWVAITLALWAWLLAAILATVAFVVVLVSAF